MEVLVTYKSKTGFSKKYAETIANKLECQYVPWEEVTTEILTGKNMVIFGGGLYAGRINGLKQAMERVKESDKNDFEKGFEQAISQSYDISSESYAEPLIDYVMRRS